MPSAAAGLGCLALPCSPDGHHVFPGMCHSLLNVCHSLLDAHPSQQVSPDSSCVTITLACVTPFPVNNIPTLACVTPICSVSHLCGIHHTFPRICHAFLACHPLSRMDHPAPSACPHCGCWAGSTAHEVPSSWQSHAGKKPHSHLFLFIAQTALAHQQQQQQNVGE